MKNMQQILPVKKSKNEPQKQGNINWNVDKNLVSSSRFNFVDLCLDSANF
jgi:hypothetical protein